MRKKYISILLVISLVLSFSFAAYADNTDEVDPIEAFCTRLYNTCLDREPEEAGLNDWVNRLSTGSVSGADAGYFFVFSEEYLNKESTDSEYVTMLYNVFLDREPDTDGFNYWIDNINQGHSREFVFSGFVNSTEYDNICSSYGISRGSYSSNVARDGNMLITQFVMRLYTKALERDGENDGINYWCEKLLSKSMTYEGVAAGFVNSQEFLNRGLSDENYVRTLYSIFFDREADEEGLNNWVTELSGGMTRTQLLSMFSYSLEFQNLLTDMGLGAAQLSSTSYGSLVWADVYNTASYQDGIINLAQELLEQGVPYQMGHKLPQNGSMDCSGYATYCYRMTLGTMNVVDHHIQGQTNSDWGLQYRCFHGGGLQSLTDRGAWSESASLEGRYTHSLYGYIFIDKYGISSAPIMDVAQWTRYLNRVNISREYISFANSSDIRPILFDVDGNVSNYGSWEFIKNYQPGDLIMWADSQGKFFAGADNHIGIYAGNGMVYHCSNCNYGDPALPIDNKGVQLTPISSIRQGFQNRGVGGFYIYHMFN